MLETIKTKITAGVRAIVRHLPDDPKLRVATILAASAMVTTGAVAGSQQIAELVNPSEIPDELPQTGIAYPAPDGSPTPYPQPGVASKSIEIYISSGSLAQNLPFVTNPIQKDDGTPAKDTPVDFALVRPDGKTSQFTMNTNSEGRVVGVLIGDQLAKNGKYQLVGRLSEGARVEGKTTFAISVTQKAGTAGRSISVTDGPAGQPGQPGTQGARGQTADVPVCPHGSCVSLQESDGTPEEGNLYVTGSIRGSSVSGEGSGLTGLDAGNIASGTLAESRLTGNVALLNASQTFSGTPVFRPAVDGDGAFRVQQSNGTDLINVDTLTGAVSVSGLAADGSQVTNLDAGNIASGTLADGRLSDAVSKLGQTIENAELLGGISDDKLDTISSAGKVSDSALTGNVALLNASQTFTGSPVFQNTFDGFSAFQVKDAVGTDLINVNTLTGAVNVNGLVADGSQVTNLDASNVASGILADVRLSSNVPFKDAANTFTNDNVFGGNVTLGANDADTVSFNAKVDTDIVPTDQTKALGSAGTFFQDGYIQNVHADTISANNIEAISTGIAGTDASSFTVNADNVSPDAESADLIFYLGTVSHNAVLHWNATLKQFELNQPIQFRATEDSSVALTVKNTDGTIAPLSVDTTGSTAVNVTNLSASGVISGIGSGLTDLNASNISSGTLGDARLSSNVALKNAANTFTALNTFQNGITSPGSASGSERFGSGASTSSFGNSLAVGNGALAEATGATAIGYQTGARSSNAVIIGANAGGGSSGSSVDAVVVGRSASASAASVTVLGPSANAAGSHAVAIGNSASASAAADNSIALGRNASVSATQTIAIGYGATQSGSGGSSTRAIAIGYNSNVGNFGGSIALGAEAVTTAANQLVIGGSTSSGSAADHIQSAYIGNGVTNATPVGFTLNGTGGSGTNIAGASVAIAGGKGTGSAAGGDLNFQIAKPDGSGSAANALATVFSLNGTGGAALFKNSADAANAFRVQKSDSTDLINVNTSTGAVTITGLAGSGASLTNLNASNISSGTLDDARLSSNVTLQGNTFNAASKLVQLDGSGNLPALNGSALTNLNASSISSGSLADARLSSNVALKNINNAFSTSQSITNAGGKTTLALTNTGTDTGLTIGGDSNLYRSAADTLKTDDSLTVAGTLSSPGSGANSERFGAGSTTSTFLRGTAVGYGATVTGNSAVALGYNTSSAGTSIGNQTSTDANGGVAIGVSATSSGNSIAAGNSASSSGSSIAIGGQSVSANNTAALGYQANASFAGSVAIGREATTTAGNQLVIGGGSSFDNIQSAYIGNGVTNVAPVSFTLNATGVPAGATNTAGASLTFAGGKGTGSGVGGDLNFQIAKPGSSGTSVNSLATVFSLSGSGGNALFKNSVDAANAFRVQKSDSTDLINVNTSTGAVTISGLAGSGASLTNLNASNISSGTLADGRLSSNVALKNINNAFSTSQSVTNNGGKTTFQLSNTTANVGLTIGGDANLYRSAADELRTDDSVAVGTSGYAAADPGSLSLSLNGAPSDAVIYFGDVGGSLYYDGTGGSGYYFDNNVTASGFVGDGSQLSNVNASQLNSQAASYYLNASNISTGTLADARLSSNVTVQGNTFNAANKLVQLDGSGNLPALNGSALTNLDAANLTGTLGALNGSNLTNLNATQLTSGFVPDARLSANVALLGAANVFTNSQTINNNGGKTTLALSNTTADVGLTIGGDTNLYRSAADTLKSDDSLTIQGTISSPGSGSNSEHFGASSTTSTFTSALAVGKSATITANNGTALGASAISGALSVAIGDSAVANNTSGNSASVAVGSGAAANASTGQNSVAIGRSATATGNSSVIIGDSATQSGSGPNNSIAIGANAALSNLSNSIVIGRSATATATNQLVIGSNSTSIQDAYIGNGVTNNSAAAVTLNATGSSTSISNGAGAALNLAGGKNTGNNAAGGKINFQTGTPGASGGVAQTLATRVSISAGTDGLTFGSAGDTNLYRSTTDTLKTDDAFVASVAGTAGTFDRKSTDGTIVSLQQDGAEEGTISVSGTTVSYNAFTGSHYADAKESIDRGMLVTQTGANDTQNDKPGAEVVYGIKRSTQANDPKVMGSYLSVLNPKEKGGKKNRPESNSNPSLVMAVGNGEVWITDTGKDLGPGDNLISSGVAGHAQMDPGTYPVSHVIAKVAEPVDWGKVEETVDQDGKKVKHKKVSVFFGAFDKTNVEPAVDEVRKGIKRVEEEAAKKGKANTDAISRLTEDVDKLVEDVDKTVAEQVENLKKSVSDLGKQVEELAGRISGAETAAGEAKRSADEASKKAGEAGGRVADLESKVEDLEGRPASSGEAVQPGADAGEIDKVNTRIDDLRDDAIAADKERATQVDERLKGLQGEIDQLKQSRASVGADEGTVRRISQDAGPYPTPDLAIPAVNQASATGVAAAVQGTSAQSVSLGEGGVTLQAGSVKTAELADGAVTSAKFKPGRVDYKLEQGDDLEVDKREFSDIGEGYRYRSGKSAEVLLLNARLMAKTTDPEAPVNVRIVVEVDGEEQVCGESFESSVDWSTISVPCSVELPADKEVTIKWQIRTDEGGTAFVYRKSATTTPYVNGFASAR
ncbi:MAG TPA: hypothetical protein VIF43_00265 [Patescibacteria group bacterium]|jgi:uncharacterized protein YoxC